MSGNKQFPTAKQAESKINSDTTSDTISEFSSKPVSVSSESSDSEIFEKSFDSKLTQFLIGKPDSSSKNPKENIEEVFLDKSEDIFNSLKESRRIKQETGINMSKLTLDTAIRIIPEFNGDSSKLHHFLSTCDTALKQVSENDAPVLFSLILTKITGSAYDQILKYGTVDSWDELKSEILSKFTQKVSEDQVHMELINARQCKNETVRDYANRIEKLESQLNDACISNEGVSAAKTIKSINARKSLNAFQEGLNPSLRLLIKACRFETLAESISEAILEESKLKLRAQNSKSFSHPINQTVNQPFNKNINPNRQLYCQFCKRPGHTTISCFRNPTNLSLSSNSPQYPVSTPRPNPNTESLRSVGLVCAYCKKNSHHISECRKRKFNNQRKSFEPPENNNNSTSKNSQGLVQNATASNTTARVTIADLVQ